MGFCAFPGAVQGSKAPFQVDHLSVGVPVEVDIVGFAVGVHPEILWRPLGPDGTFHIRAATAFKLGSEFNLIAPLSLGVRWEWLQSYPVQVGLGAGLQWKAFVVPDSTTHHRFDMYWELVFQACVSDVDRVGVALSPEFGLANITSEGLSSTFGLGLAVRMYWLRRF